MKKLLVLCFVLLALFGNAQTRSILVLSDLHVDMKLKPANFYHTDADTTLFSSVISNIDHQKFPFIIAPGDFLPHQAIHDTADMKNTYQYLIVNIQSIDTAAIVLPALGNNDCVLHNMPDKKTYEVFYNSMLKRIDFDGSIGKTFKEGGYYNYNKGDLSVIVLNSLVFAFGPDSASVKEIKWFGKTLQDDRQAGKKVWIVYHIPPGIDRYAKKPSWHEAIQHMYLDTVKKYAAIIKFQLAGHTHMDDFRVITHGQKVISYIDIAPGLDTRNGNNPAYQTVEYNGKSKIINEITTFYTDSLDKYKWSSYSFKHLDFNFLLQYDSNSKQGNEFVKHYSTNRGPVKAIDGVVIAWNDDFVKQSMIEVK